MLTLRTKPLFDEREIADRIDELAEQIIDDLGTDTPFIAAGLLRGCYVFMADLVRAISKRGGSFKEIDFLVCSSYGDGTESSRAIKVHRDIQADIEGQTVLLIDDIIDTGHTLKLVKDLLSSRNPVLIRTITLLNKPERREVKLDSDYSCFTIPNLFVVGYGLDYAQQYRELPYITVMDEI
jgi:hypoxanthine phosphoribosyltransferase